MRGGRRSHWKKEENREGSGTHLILSAARVIGRQTRRAEFLGLIHSIVHLHCFVSGYDIATMSLYSSRAGD